MDLEALEDTNNLRERVTNFHNCVDKIEKMLEIALSEKMTEAYEKFSPKEKADYDIMMAMQLNTLYWLHLRSIGEDPAEHEVMSELNRVKEFMGKIKDATAQRPKLDVPAAKRFIKHGLKSDNDGCQRPTKKMKMSKTKFRNQE